MDYSLTLSGGTIAIPKITFTGDFSITLIATQVATGRFFLGGDTTAGSLEIYKNNSSQVALYFATIGQFSGTAVLSADVNAPDTIIIIRSGTSVTVHVNGVLQGTATFSGNLHVSWFGLRTGWANLPNPMRFYSCVMQDIANPSNSRTYDASLSGGSGSVLPTLHGGNYGAQQNSWPSDDSEWIPRQGASLPTVQPKSPYRNSPTGSIKPPAFIPWNNAESIAAEFWQAPEITTFTSTIAYDIGAIDYAVSANATSTNVTSTIAYDVGAITFVASSNVTTPTVTTTVSHDIGAVNFASTASVGVRSTLAYDIGSVDFAVNSLLSTRAAAAFDIGSIDFSSVASVGNSTTANYDIGEIEYLVDALNREDTQAVVSFDIGDIEYLVSANFMMAEPERSLSTRNVTFWGNSPYFNPSRRI